MRVTGRKSSIRPQEIEVEGPGDLKIKFDGWDVLAAAAFIWLLLSYTIDDLKGLRWLGFALLGLWLVLVLLVNLGIVRKKGSR